MAELLFPGPVVFVYLAMIAYTAGLLFRNEFFLRVLVMCGATCDTTYYYFYPEEPLWDAMLGSTLIFSATFFGLIRLLVDQAPSLVGSHHDAFNCFQGMMPGDFRRLMRFGNRHRAEEPVQMTEAGRKPPHLYLIVSGKARVTKGSASFEVAGPTFIGEIAFMTDEPASATVEALPGAHYVMWRTSDLRKLLEKQERLATAFSATMARDMAHKVAASAQHNDLTPSEQAMAV
jgi:CRP-like cAMP-binding protein